MLAIRGPRLDQLHHIHPQRLRQPTEGTAMGARLATLYAADGVAPDPRGIRQLLLAEGPHRAEFLESFHVHLHSELAYRSNRL